MRHVSGSNSLPKITSDAPAFVTGLSVVERNVEQNIWN
jgi:hypothetical protein